MRPLLQEDHFPPVISQTCQFASVGPVEKFFPWIRASASKKRTKVITVKMHFESFPCGLVSCKQLFLDIRFTRSCNKCWQNVFMRSNTVDLCSRFNNSRPT